MNKYNNETVICKECECDYDFTNNNQYGYFNCCSPCGENKYEEYLEEQEELKKRKEINFNDLPCAIMTKIMNINKNREKEEKLIEEAKLGYNACGNHILILNEIYKDEHYDPLATDNIPFNEFIDTGGAFGWDLYNAIESIQYYKKYVR